VSALDPQIDTLYQLKLSDFTSARNALAISLAGADAARVRALAKPTIVPWTVNQVYWRARGIYDRLMQSGGTLRTAQVAALEGRAADVRGAGDAHRRAIADAVAEGTRLAAPAGAKPDTDALGRAFEALSLASRAAEPPGRLTDAPQLAGFEALAGITNIQLRTEKSEVRTERVEAPKKRDPNAAKEAARAAAEAARIAAERKKHEAAVKEAEALLARAEMKERSSRETWERAHDELLAARSRVADVKRTRVPSS
jgi:hypothetical protein